MAPLNPYAPLYQPTAILLPPLEYYPPPLYHSVPPPPPFHFYFNQNPLGTTVFCSVPSSPPLPDPFLAYYTTTAPHTLGTGFRDKEWGCVERVHQPWAMALPLPPFLQHEKVPVSFGEDEVSEVQREMSATKIEEVAEEARDGEGTERGGSGWAACRVRRIWKPKGLRSLSEFVGRRVWPPKSRSRNKQLFLTLGEEFEFKEEEEAGVGEVKESRTTVMIKNLPNKMNKGQLIELLDKHCHEENQKLGEVEGMGDATNSEYDFLYLPMDFDSGSNLGYAFVNFTRAIAARRLHRAYHKRGWDLLGSRKVREVTYARIQGLQALLKHFKNSVFVCDNDEYLPVYFTPNRNGTCNTDQHYVGRRMPSSRRSTA